MIMVSDEVEKKILWVLGKGDIDASLDKWIETPLPSLSERLQVKSFFLNEHQLNVVVTRLGTEAYDSIRNAQIQLTNEHDKMC